MLLLTLKVFSLTGGIEMVSRTMAKALQEYATVNPQQAINLEVLSLCDKSSDVDTRYCDEDRFKGYNGNKALFGFAAFFRSLKKDTLILSHINLLFISVCARLLFPKKRIIMLAHGIEIWRDLRPWKRNFLKKNIEIWAVSQFTANVLINKHGINPKQITVLNNCLDPYFKIPETLVKPPYLLHRHQINNNQPILLTLTRLSSTEMYKGYDAVIAATKNLIPHFPNLKYLIAGKADAAEQIRIENMIQNLGLENHVALIGFVSDDELADYFRLADLFTMPSKKEGFGIVFIEAAACGCTPMAGNQDGSTDALLNGELGLLVNPDNLAEIESTIFNFLKQPKTLADLKATQQKSIGAFNYLQYRDKVFNLLHD